MKVKVNKSTGIGIENDSGIIKNFFKLYFPLKNGSERRKRNRFSFVKFIEIISKKNIKYAFKSFFKCFKKIFSKKVFFGELLFKGFRRRFEMHSSY